MSFYTICLLLRDKQFFYSVEFRMWLSTLLCTLCIHFIQAAVVSLGRWRLKWGGGGTEIRK